MPQYQCRLNSFCIERLKVLEEQQVPKNKQTLGERHIAPDDFHESQTRSLVFKPSFATYESMNPLHFGISNVLGFVLL